MAGFREIIGQDHIVRHFQNAIKLNKISHAYIINGEAYSGKKMLARAFAMSLLCENGTGEPCMECHSCKQSLTNNHPDIKWITYEKSGIGVDEIREQINNDVIIKPYSSPYKVYIVPDAEKMTIQAQNALLKTIEEPPAYVVILLLTTNADMFLPTILSRCVILNTKYIKDEIIKKYLMEKEEIPDYAASVATTFAEGNLGKAINLASSDEFNAMKDEVVRSANELLQANSSKIAAIVKKSSEYKNELDEYMELLRMWYRDILMYKATGDINYIIFIDETDEIKRQAARATYLGLNKVFEAIDKALTRIKSNVNFDMTLEIMFLTIKERINS
ncbi:MAG: DNA polymerase III subunit delta' [Eubacterium sp.]